MEHSVSTKLKETDETPPRPDEPRSTKKVKIQDDPSHDNFDMLSYDPISHSDVELVVEEIVVTNTSEDNKMGDTPLKVTPPLFKDMPLNFSTKQKAEDEDLQLHEGDITVNRPGPSLS